MKKQINVGDNLEVTFKASELAQIINNLSSGAADTIGFLNNRILEAHSSSQAQTSESDPKPIGGGGGGPVKPPRNE